MSAAAFIIAASAWALANYLWFARPNKAELRRMIQSEIDADRVSRSGLTGWTAKDYTKALKTDRLKASSPSEAPRA